MVAEAVATLDGDGGAVLLLDEARQTLSMSAGVGWPLREEAWFTKLPLSVKTPTTDAVRMRRTVHVGDPREQRGRYGNLAEERIRAGIAATLALPLLSGPRTVGGLLVTFSTPREFSEDELEFAEQVADRCASGIARALLYEREHETAAALQRSLMPTALPNLDSVQFGARFRPAGTGEVVGGDFYDVLDLGDDRFVAWIGDVQGKGPTAAAVAALARYTLRAEIRHVSSPDQLLQALNEAVLSQSEPGDRLLTAVCVAGKVSGDVLELDVAVAGHPPPLILRRDQPCAEVGASGTLIGFEQVTFASAKLTPRPRRAVRALHRWPHRCSRPARVRGRGGAVPASRRAGPRRPRRRARLPARPRERRGKRLPRDDIALLGIQFAPRSPRGAGSLAAARTRLRVWRGGGAAGSAATVASGPPLTRLSPSRRRPSRRPRNRRGRSCRPGHRSCRPGRRGGPPRRGCPRPR